MNLRHKLKNRAFQIVCLLAVFGAIGYSTFKFSTSGNLSFDEEFEEENGEVDEEENEALEREQGLRFRLLQLQDENGVIAPDGLRKAKRQMELMKKAQKKRAAKQKNQIQEAGVLPESWTWLGPGNIGGRIRSIVIHPTNTNNMWVGSVSGGIWKTTNGGASWSPVNDFMANLAVSAMVINPTNPNIMYAGTGEGVYIRNSSFQGGVQGAGVFRSNDGGTTWNQLPSTAISSFNFVNRLAISPNGNTILAATNAGVFRSTNGGTSWTETGDLGGTDIDFHPTDSTRAVYSGFGLAYYSDDGGQTWYPSNFPIIFVNARIEMAYAPGNPNIVYASADVSSGTVYRSSDGGETFSDRGTPAHLGKQGDYANAIWVNPQDANFVIVGGGFLYRSTDGGTTFTPISEDSSNAISAHVDQHIIVAHPAFNNNTNKTVFFGNDGGIFRATNVATVSQSNGWTELDNNLGITQFYGGAGNSTSGVIIGGTQDNGTNRYNGGTETWSQTFGADGGYSAADQTNPNYFYGEKQKLGIFRSGNAGITGDLIAGGITDRTAGADGDCLCNFIAPFVLDPNNPNRLLAGGASLWRTNNARAATPMWSAIKEPFTSESYFISAIAIAPGNSDFIVVGHNQYAIFLTTNGTNASPTWTNIATSQLPNRIVTRLVIDVSHSPNPWIYATFGGFSADNIYVTKNLGTTWTDITGSGESGLPDVPVRTLTFHPRNPNLLYVGTEVGIFTSNDAGANWDLPNGGPANVSVDELFWVAGDLIAATHGRGMYRASGGLYVDCNYNGVQFGTFDQPFRTVNAAINALTSYRPIWLKPCNYNETISPTTKKFEIRSLGGTATVGTP